MLKGYINSFEIYNSSEFSEKVCRILHPGEPIFLSLWAGVRVSKAKTKGVGSVKEDGDSIQNLQGGVQCEEVEVMVMDIELFQP